MRRLILKDFDDDSATVDLTPLIDVVFVVLIVFILLAPLLQIDSIQLAGGSQKTATHPLVEEKNGILIDLHKDGSIRINKRDIARQDLTVLLNALHSANSESIPKLFCDKEVSFGEYQKLKNAIEDAGFEALDIVVSPQ